MKQSITVCLTLLLIAGCQDPEETLEAVPLAPADIEAARSARDNPLPSAGDAGSPVAGTAASEQVRDFDGTLRLTIPAGWQEAELSPMQRSVLLAKYTVPGRHPDIEVTISSAAGGLSANLDRWRGQFSGADASEKKVEFADATAVILRLRGDYHPGFGRPDRTDWIMLGAALPAPDHDFYIKLTGPADAVRQLEDEFRGVVSSARFIRN